MLYLIRVYYNKKFISFFTLFLLLAYEGVSQTTATLSGSVIDAKSKELVAFATVALQDRAGSIITGTTGNADGKFTITKIAPGSYKLIISFIGYQNKALNIFVSDTNTNLQLGTIELAPDTKSLEEVVVTAEKPLIEDTEDGFVYNAEKDINATGGTAADLLKNVPGLVVDMDGNLEMQGTTKIQVLIDNKPSSIMAGDLAEALRQIPADIIEKVEVITSPSAKYDAEGTGGIVNIITKKDRTLQGYNGSVSASAGNRANSINANLNARKGKVGLKSSLGGNVNRRFGNSENEQIYYRGKTVSQNNEYQNNGQGFNGSFGGDIDFNERNNLRANIRTSQYSGDNDRINRTLEVSTIEESYGRILEQNRRLVDSKSASGSIDAYLDYSKDFKKDDQELDLTVRYSSNERQSKNYTTRENGESIINLIQQNNNVGANNELSFQADYEHPFDKYGRLEIGTKAILRQTVSNYLFASSESPGKALETDPNRTNIFNYDQHVYASYFSYSLYLKKKYSIRLGGRYENTNIFANFQSKGTYLNRPYANFMPNVAVSIKFKNNQRLRLTYSTRIHRPQIHYLNPYIDDTNERSIRVGNPDLDPEATHATSLNYSNYFKKTSIQTSVYWRQTNNDIGSYRTFSRRPSRVAPYDTIDALTTTYLNIGRNTTYGTNVSVSGRIKDRARVGGNIGVYYNEINGLRYASEIKENIKTFRSSFMYNINLNGSYRFPKDLSGPLKNFSAQFSTSLNSPRIHAQGKSTSFQRYNVGLRKEFMDRALSISFSIENFLNSGNQIRTTTYDERFTNTSIQNYYNRVFRLSLSYRIKKMAYIEKQPKI